ncbi:hypothetical protein [Adhaeribacter aquaticus]|uniref:hypothetical protein n=1 Tax=Adhaeribacter aquaticus TaxID=299567 RepID=UPI0004293C77|nr:hypothetical protein [Adhaeribacter aquaticus]
MVFASLIIFLVVLAGAMKALADAIAHGKIIYNGPFWSNSGEAKWKNGDKAQGEKFWGSSTFFVALTDAWHLANLIQYACFFGGMVCFFQLGVYCSAQKINPIYPLLFSILAKVFFHVVFEFLYSKVLTRKEHGAT